MNRMFYNEKYWIVLLIGLFLFGPAGVMDCVLCHGEDGHVALEPADHNHCDCPATPNDKHHDADAIHHAHQHCRDVALPALPLMSTGKMRADMALSVFIGSPLLGMNQEPAARAWPPVIMPDYSAFHSPLHSVILRA